jgi:hypothetical protein
MKGTTDYLADKFFQNVSKGKAECLFHCKKWLASKDSEPIGRFNVLKPYREVAVISPN